MKALAIGNPVPNHDGLGSSFLRSTRSLARSCGWLPLLLAVLAAPSKGQSTSFVRSHAYDPRLSDDGAFVVYERLSEIWVLEIATSLEVRASVDSNGLGANAASEEPDISSDGRFVVFSSKATNLVPGGSSGLQQVYRHDMLTGENVLVSVTPTGTECNGVSGFPRISGDGRYVSFESTADDLTVGDTNGEKDVFVRDLQSQKTWMASTSLSGVAGNGMSYEPGISRDGQFVVFYSTADDLVDGDTNGFTDAFVHGHASKTTWRVSVSSTGAQANFGSGGWGWSYPALSGDGRYAVFPSFASNLVAGDTNSFTDIFLHDRVSGTTERVSISSDGSESNGLSQSPAISGDGRFVFFASDATNLIAGDTNGVGDAFVHDRQSSVTSRISVSTTGAQGNDASESGHLSADGRLIIFRSRATNLATSGDEGIYLRDQGCPPNFTYYQDADGDGYGDPGVMTQACSVPPGFSLNHLDCDDTDPDVHPGLDETCNGIDDNCNGATDEGCVVGYCTPKVNSLGCTPTIGASAGYASLSGPDDFVIEATDVLSGTIGILIWSRVPDAKPFGGGTLCVGWPIIRTGAQSSGGSPPMADCTGSYAYLFTQVYMIQHLLAGGTPVHAQYWSRDPGFGPPNGIGLTGGLEFIIGP